MSVERLDLERGRDLGGVLRDTVRLYRSNLLTVLAVSGAIVVTVNLIVGAGLNELTSRYRADLGTGARTAQLLVSLLVLGPLINAVAAALVQALGGEGRPRAFEVLQRGLDVFAPALIVVVLYWVAVVAGLFVLVLPGIYVYVLWAFAVQTVTIEGRRGFAALQRSAELVSGNWFRVAGILLIVTLIGNVPVYGLGIAVDAAAKAADAQIVSLAGATIIELFSLPFVALASALLFFDLRVRHSAGVRRPPGG